MERGLIVNQPSSSRVKPVHGPEAYVSHQACHAFDRSLRSVALRMGA